MPLCISIQALVQPQDLESLAYNHPLGDDHFRTEIEAALGRYIGDKKRSRPEYEERKSLERKMASLLEIFKEQSSGLLNSLSTQVNRDSATETTREFLDRLRIAYLMRGDLDEAEQQLVSGLIECIKETSQVLSAGRAQPYLFLEEKPAVQQEQEGNKRLLVGSIVSAVLLIGVLAMQQDIVGLLLLLITAGLLGSLMLRLFPRQAGLFGALVLRLISGQPSPSDLQLGSDKEVGKLLQHIRARVEVQPETWVARLENAIRLVDSLVVQFRLRALDRKKPLRLDREMLDFLQDLMEAHYEQDGVFALKKIQFQVPALLKREGISVVSYDGTNAQLFELEKQPRGEPITKDEPHTIRPALIRDNECIRLGRATVVSKSIN